MANKNPLTYTGEVLATTKRAGVCQFDSSSFSVTNGVVSLKGGGQAIDTIAGDSGTATPTSAGTLTLAGGTAITTSATTNTGTISADVATDAQAQDKSSGVVLLTPSNLAAIDSGTNITFTQSPLLQSNANTGAAPVGTNSGKNIMICQGGEIMEVYNIGTQTIIAPRMETAGLLVSRDLTSGEGSEYNWGTRTNSKHTYTIGTSPAFFLEWRFTLADVSGCNPFGIGFRKVASNNASLANYTDFAFIGVSESDNSGTLTLKTRLNSGSVTNTNTTDTWSDGETHTLKILVSGAGVVTYEIDGAAPTTTAAFTFDDTDVVIPFFRGVHGASSPGKCHWVSNKAGLQ